MTTSRHPESPARPRGEHLVRWWFAKVEPPSARVCTECRRPLVLLDDVGWVDVTILGSYDLCEVDRYAAHSPELPARR